MKQLVAYVGCLVACSSSSGGAPSFGDGGTGSSSTSVGRSSGASTQATATSGATSDESGTSGTTGVGLSTTGGGSGTLTASGSLVVKSGFAVVGTESLSFDDAGPANVAAITLSSYGGSALTCASLPASVASNDQFANATSLSIYVVSNTAVTTATYGIIGVTGGAVTLPAASVSYNGTNATCASAPVGEPMSGSVTISTISSSEITGSYSLVFSSGPLVGSFAVPVCTGVDVSALFSSSPVDAGAPHCL